MLAVTFFAVTFYLLGSVCFIGGFIVGALLIKSGRDYH